jgi:putative redox protein
MSKMTTFYPGELRTEGTHLLSGTKILTDPPLDNHGKGEAYSPTDLLCAALSSCMITIMGILANKDKLDITGMNAEVTKTMAANPRRVSEIKIDLSLPEQKISLLSEANKEALKKAAHTCPVALSIHPDIKQNISFNF